jgi:hypothetical protein
MAVYLAPIGNDAPYSNPATGAPFSGANLYVYLSGSSTPATTYTTSAGSVANSSPMELNSAGYPTTSGVQTMVWLTGGATYKFVLESPAGVVLWTRDNVPGIGDTSITVDQWVAGPTPTFVSTTQFTLVGDKTSDFHVGRRVKTTNSGGTIYSTITVSAFTTVTTVTVVNESGTLDVGLSAVSYGLLSAVDPSTPVQRDNTFRIADNADPTKLIAVQASGITTATTRTLQAPNANVVIGFPKGYIFGCGMANNSGDATNDIDFSTGQATDSTGVIDIVAVTAMTKQLDVAWAAGTAAGGKMSAAAITDTTYHCFIIRKDSDGTADFGFDTSATAPTMPTGYTFFRRIGSIIRASSAIVGFTQKGSKFYRKVPAQASNSGDNPGTSALTMLAGSPLGVKFEAVIGIYHIFARDNLAAAHGLITDPDTTDTVPSATINNFGPGLIGAVVGATPVNNSTVNVHTDTSGQVRVRVSGSASGSSINLTAIGWIDQRGRDE